MRLLPVVLVVAVCSAAPPVSAGPIVPWRTAAWHPVPLAAVPGAAAVPAIRFDPEGGSPPASPELPDLPAQVAARRAALARVPVLTRADGSRHATLGGLARAYTVARIGADGALSQTCVTSAAQAYGLVAAPARETER